MRHPISKLALAGLLTLGCIGGAAYAQDQGQDQSQQGPPPDGGGGGHRRGMMDPDEQLKHMTKDLSLTADQQTQIKPILVGQQQQMQSLRGDQSLSREDRMTKMRAIHEDTKAKIEATLTPDQKTKYEQMEAERMQHMRDGGGPPPQGGGQPQ